MAVVDGAVPLLLFLKSPTAGPELAKFVVGFVFVLAIVGSRGELKFKLALLPATNVLRQIGQDAC